MEQVSIFEGAKQPSNHKIFLDCGAYDGGSVFEFARYFENWREFEVHCFEADPNKVVDLSSIAPEFVTTPLIHRVAVSDSAGVAPFYLSTSDRGEGCSLLSEKTTGDLDLNNPVDVATLDLSEFFDHYVPSDARVVLKLNIEGMEYRVLTSLLNSGAIHCVDILFGEWHWKKIGMTMDEHVDFISKLPIKMEPWQGIRR